MQFLTADQAIQLADYFHEASFLIGAYVIKNQDNLTPEEKGSLVANQWRILDKADDLLNYATELVFADANRSLEDINQIIEVIDQKLKTLQNIQKAIDIATDFVTLTQAIFSKNPQAIVKSISDLKTKLEV